MSLTGYAEFADAPRVVTADRIFWTNYCFQHISEIIKLLVDNSENLTCCCCGGNYSLHYNTKGSLFNHYKSHRHETVEYYLNNFVKKSVDELNNTQRADAIVNGALH